MEDQFFEESLKAVRSSFRNMILAIIASMSLFTLSASDPEFDRVVQFGKDLLSIENKSPLLAVQFDAFRKQSDSLTAKKFANPIEQLTSSMKQSGYILHEKSVRTLKSYSPAPTFSKKITVNGSQEMRLTRTVLPTDLGFWLNEFPHIADLNHHYQQPKPGAEIALLKPHTTTWTGCQKTVNFSPRCEGSSRPEGLLSGIGTSGTVASLGIWLEYKLEKPSQCKPTQDVQTTPYNYPKMDCEWSELPDSSYRSAAQKIGLKIPASLLDPPSKEVITRHVGDHKDIQSLIDAIFAKNESDKTTQFYSLKIDVSTSEIVVGLATFLFSMIFVYNVFHLRKFTSTKLRLIRKFPTLPLSRSNFFWVTWVGLFAIYIALLIQWYFWVSNTWLFSAGIFKTLSGVMFLVLWVTQLCMLAAAYLFARHRVVFPVSQKHRKRFPLDTMGE